MSKRYQIFVSSTFVDLEEERGKVMKAILNFNCFPAGIELFPAMDEEQFDYIKKIIDDSDYFLLIIAGRYGSVDQNGVSWTEKEYDYAVSRGIPVLAFIHSDYSMLPHNKVDIETNKLKKLEAFKTKVSSGRHYRRWTKSDELASAVVFSLSEVFDYLPRIGWIRANTVDGRDSQNDSILEELERIREELNELKTQEKINDEERHNLEIKYQESQDRIKQLLNDHENYKNQVIEIEQKRHDTEQSCHEAQSTIKVLESNLKRMLFIIENKNKYHEDLIFELPESENIVSFKMIYVEGGKFLMGADNNDDNAGHTEGPVHEVTLSDYWIGETQVTQALWKTVMNNNPSQFTGDLNLPVEQVSWDDCQEFVNCLNDMLKSKIDQLGFKFCLPTEAQWEFAARGGNLGKNNCHRYSGSNVIDEVAWYKFNSNGKTHPVARDKKPNELGIYDMSGNVWEWCQDIFGVYSGDSQHDPKGSKEGGYRVNRGGRWSSSERRCRVCSRNYQRPNSKERSDFDYLGLRLALVPIY